MNSEHATFGYAAIAGLGRRKSGRDKKYATFNRRMLAATVDSLLLMFAAPVFNWLAPIHTEALERYTADMNDPDAGKKWLTMMVTDPAVVHSWLLNSFLQGITFCILSALCWHYWSATPGKILMRIKIVDAVSEQPISNRQCAIRALGYILSGLCLFLGFLWIGIDKRRQGWHDKLANTVVVVISRQKKSATAEEFGPT